MICCIITFSSTFWLVGFWYCYGQDTYYYIQLAQFCTANSGNENDDFTECFAWTTLADDTTGSASTDALAYHSGHGLAVTAFVFAFFCNVTLMGNLYCITDVDIKLKVRYLTALLGLIAGFFLFVVIAQDSSSYYTDADNYGNQSECGSHYSIPGASWAFCFVGVCFAGATVLGLMFPYCGCAGEERDMKANLVDPNMNSSGNAQQPPSAPYEAKNVA